MYNWNIFKLLFIKLSFCIVLDELGTREQQIAALLENASFDRELTQRNAITFHYFSSGTSRGNLKLALHCVVIIIVCDIEKLYLPLEIFTSLLHTEQSALFSSLAHLRTQSNSNSNCSSYFVLVLLFFAEIRSPAAFLLFALIFETRLIIATLLSNSITV